MQVLVVGGGPGGLTAAWLLKRACRGHDITLADPGGGPDWGGLGITLPETALKRFELDLPYRKLTSFSIRLETRQQLVTKINSISISRRDLTQLLRSRCLVAGVTLCRRRVSHLTDRELKQFDLIIGADGARSVIREMFANDFCPLTTRSPLYHCWLATTKLFGDELPRIFTTFAGEVFGAAAYQFSSSLSTFVVECAPRATERGEFTNRTDAEVCMQIARVFDRELDHMPVSSGGKVTWRRFATTVNLRWHHRNVVLVGDAAHTTHFCKGFGTSAAMDDSACVVEHLLTAPTLPEALQRYEHERKPLVDTVQSKTDSAQRWYEGLMTTYERKGAEAARAQIRQLEQTLSTA